MHTEQNKQFGKIPLILLMNTLVGFFFGLCLLLFASVLVWCEWFPEGVVESFPAVSVVLSCALSAFLSGKALGRGLLFGIIHGVVQYILSYLMGLLVFLRLVPSGWHLKLLICALVGGVCGGILSATRIRLKRY